VSFSGVKVSRMFPNRQLLSTHHFFEGKMPSWLYLLSTTTINTISVQQRTYPFGRTMVLIHLGMKCNKKENKEPLQTCGSSQAVDVLADW
jgi:hypothetical protein